MQESFNYKLHTYWHKIFICRLSIGKNLTFFCFYIKFNKKHRIFRCISFSDSKRTTMIWECIFIILVWFAGLRTIPFLQRNLHEICRMKVQQRTIKKYNYYKHKKNECIVRTYYSNLFDSPQNDWNITVVQSYNHVFYKCSLIKKKEKKTFVMLHFSAVIKEKS